MKGSKTALLGELEERLRFETLLADISTQFINLPSDQIDSGIEDAQRRVCECLGLDMSTLWQWSDADQRYLTLTHTYSPPAIPLRLKRLDAQEALPWTVQKLLRKETLVFSSIDELPPEAVSDREIRRQFGVRSSVSIPLSTGGGPLIGVLTFNTLLAERTWPPETVNRLNLVAQIFSNALARQQSDSKLRESEARLRLAADSAGAILWELEIDTGHLWTTEQGKEFFGFAPDSQLSLDSFLLVVHPDDRGMLRRGVAEAMRSGLECKFEYRIERAHGDNRWVISLGRPYSTPVPRLIGASIDITERKMIEERILGSEARLAAAIDTAALGFYELGEDYRMIFLDDRMRDILGVAPADEQHTRQFWLSHIHPEDLAWIVVQSRQVLEQGVDRFMGEYRYLHPERGVTWLRHVSRVLERDAAGRAVRVIGVMQDITERKHEEDKLKKSEAALKHNQKDLQRLAGRLISTQEEELRRLSRELHDDLTQRLAVLAIDAGKLEQRLDNEESTVPIESLQKISRIKEQLISISEDVHRISRQLHPTILDDLGLIQAIESECEAIQMRENIEIMFSHEGVVDRIRDDIALCLYRIIQEGLKNIIRHSGATKCEIILKVVDDTLCLTITDEGRGFDAVEERKKPGLGLSSMRERAQLVDGDFSIESWPGQGTVIRVNVSLTQERT